MQREWTTMILIDVVEMTNGPDARDARSTSSTDGEVRAGDDDEELGTDVLL